MDHEEKKNQNKIQPTTKTLARAHHVHYFDQNIMITDHFIPFKSILDHFGWAFFQK